MESIDPILEQLSLQSSYLKKQDVRNDLIDCIHFLLVHDFSRLIQILYRIDVNEIKLKQLLREQPQTDAAVLIADLLIERHLEKMKARAASPPPGDISEEEKW